MGLRSVVVASVSLAAHVHAQVPIELTTGVAAWQILDQTTAIPTYSAAPTTGLAGGWYDPAGNGRPGSWLGDSTNAGNSLFYELTFTLTAVEAQCAHISGVIAADDSASFRVSNSIHTN